jgi:3-O-methylgallate 3,4-dioxygenase
MAELVAAFASSHSIMLTCELSDWKNGFRQRDPDGRYFDRNGDPCTYADLLARAPANAGEIVSESAITERYNEVQTAMGRMSSAIAAAKLDVLIVCGDDQHEIFNDLAMPPIAVYYGDTIRNAASSPSSDWFVRAQMRRLEDGTDVHYPCQQKLALHLINGLSDANFEITAMKGLPKEKYEGHAFSFFHRKYLKGATTPIIPILLNTFYWPNPLRPERCVALGVAIRQLIASYPERLRVGIAASGGLSHFQAEEDLDRPIIDALKRKDLDFLGRLNIKRLQAGSSEIRNWIVVAAAARDLNLSWVSYTPAYRTPALTGTGLGFAVWQPAGSA